MSDPLCIPSPDTLTDQLRRHGFLEGGAVVDAQMSQRFETVAGDVVRLHISYTPDIRDRAPRTVICKIFGPRWYDHSGQAELRFYRDLAPQMPHIPVPLLYGAIDSPDTHTCTLLIEDLDRQYMPANAPIAYEWLEHTTDVLAQLHAFWWQNPRLDAPAFLLPEEEVTRMPQALDAAGILINETHAQKALEDFVKRYDADLAAEDRMLVKQLAGSWRERFCERTEGGRGITLIHGDFHLLGNVFLARDATTVPRLKIIDWSQAKRGLGPHDLMYSLIAVDSKDRIVRDTWLLRRYHAGLGRMGITGYSWEQCLWDYRFSMLTNIWQSLFHGSLYWFHRTAKVVRTWDSVQLLEAPSM